MGMTRADAIRVVLKVAKTGIIPADSSELQEAIWVLEDEVFWDPSEIQGGN